MKQPLLSLRWGLVFFALVLAFVTFLRSSGIVTFECNEYCAVIQDWRYSPLVSLLAMAGILAIAVSLSKQDEVLFRWLVWGGVGVSLAFQMLAMAWQGVCPWCMGLAFMMLGIALTTVRWKSLGFVSLAPAAFGVYVIYDSVPHGYSQDLISFAYRPYESRPADPRVHEYVIYADPECPACKRLAREEEKIKLPEVVFHYRWYLLPATSGRTLHAAVAIETVSKINAQAGLRLRRAIFESNERLTDATILEISSRLGLENEVKSALDHPGADVLGWVEQDGRAFEKAGFSAVPTPGTIHDGRAVGASPKMIYNMAKKDQQNPEGDARQED
jgi:hypothetical protein